MRACILQKQNKVHVEDLDLKTQKSKPASNILIQEYKSQVKIDAKRKFKK